MGPKRCRLISLGSVRRWLGSVSADRAQDSFEYLLVIGGVVVAMIIGLLAFDVVVALLLGASCPSVDTAKGIAATAGSCLQ